MFGSVGPPWTCEAWAPESGQEGLSDYNQSLTHQPECMDTSGQEQWDAPPTPEIISEFAGGDDPRLVQAMVSCVFDFNDAPGEDCCIMSAPQPATMVSPVSVSATTPLMDIGTTRTRLIKDSLKVTIQSRRRAQGKISVTPPPSPLPVASPVEELTEEDSERRKRRRERNKIAATKCRNKKKERTCKLAVESTTLESSNGQLKQEIEMLEQEKHGLLDLLRQHLPVCERRHRPHAATATTFYGTTRH